MAATGLGTGPWGGGGRARCCWHPRSRLCVGVQLALTSRARTGVRRAWRLRAAGSDLVTDFTTGRPLATAQTFWNASTGVSCGLRSLLEPLKPKLGQSGKYGRREPRRACYRDCHLTWLRAAPTTCPAGPTRGAPASLKVLPLAVWHQRSWSLPLRQKPAPGHGESLGIETLRWGFESAVTSLAV